MRFIVSRLVRTLLWLLLSLLVLLAILISALRVALPHMNQYQIPMTEWMNSQAEIQFSVKDIQGFWRNRHPSLSLTGFQAHLPDTSNIHFAADRVDIEFDLFKSLLQWQPVIANLVIHQSKLDVSSVDLFQQQSLNDSRDRDEQEKIQLETIRHLDNIFLRQLDDFSILNSTIRYRSISGDIRQLEIARLKWQNNGHRHQAQGVVSVTNTGINSLSVRADFEDFDSFHDISGQFYVSSDNISIGPWLTQYLKKETGIHSGQVSFNGWLTLEHNTPKDGYVQVRPSDLFWSDLSNKHSDSAPGKQHRLHMQEGTFRLIPKQDGMVIQAQSVVLQTDETQWPELNFLMKWQPDHWLMNIGEINIGSLVPLIKRMPLSKQLQGMLVQLKPQGTLHDIRLAGDMQGIRQYSAQLSEGAIQQWSLLPEVHHLQASIRGNTDKAVIRANLDDDTLPYGDVFQAPLIIQKGQVNLVWQSTADGWSLWSDHVAVRTPDLQTVGQFKLDFFHDQSPLLSLYTEVDLFQAGETWRYLPVRALGDELTDYLSTAIQGGEVKTAKILWYGRLNDFPYQRHDGIFQAWVGLKNARFSYDTAWPPLTDLQVNLLFQNESMYLDSKQAHLMDVNALRITGRIPVLIDSGHIEIEAKAEAQGNALRDFMTSTPLVNSVGAALTTVQVNGKIQSEFQLNIPFESHREPRAWGWADLKNNRVDIQSPSLDLRKVSGRIRFDNDVVTASALQGEMLGQPVSWSFQGESGSKGYNVHIDTVGDWEVTPLASYVGQKWIAPLSGHAPWEMGVDIQLNDIGFSYQANLDTDLQAIASQYPYPLNKKVQEQGKAVLQISGNQETISARIQVPHAKYQTEIDVTQSEPVLTATNLIFGNGSFKVSPIVGHSATIRLNHFDLDQWIALLTKEEAPSGAPKSSANQAMSMPQLPIPDHIEMQVKDLTLATLEWHDVDFLARHKSFGWRMNVQSQEVQGKANYIAPYDLSVALDQLHLYIPALEKRKEHDSLFIDESRQNERRITNFDRQFHQLMPNLTLVIQDFWFQGYKVGRLNMDFQRQGKELSWKNIDIVSGSNEIHVNGQWTLDGKQSHTVLNMDLKGDNNSDLMERFGITSGIQNAPFSIKTQMAWDGAPWAAQVDTLKGSVSSKLGKGSISDVSGAARFLGLFSLDSIIRKMQLDFSDVFDQGMAFNSIKGSGEISQGVFVTNNIEMDALAGNMTIKGIVDLNANNIDAEVHFVPDMTSGIPVLSAFAVNPVTGLYVLAITTVISPVVEVFTEVNYEVKGPIDNPVVKEISRSKGEFKLPEKLREEAQQHKQGATQ
ncbi:YhdP family protein [Vibrio sp. MEBiC08052]|uniref:YhdP family protein n=1 Tax=Vibrio sp. MEBiC08052 TaxID=1761910 RepID=UPI000740F1BB|nr:YhdP family protein [Vibrio sp. MEBiC08052]